MAIEGPWRDHFSQKGKAMKNTISSRAALALLLLSLPLAANAATQVYDLKADWSDTQNPNGTWSYREGGESLLPNDPFPWANVDAGFGTDTITKTTEAEVVPGQLELGDVFVRTDVGGVIVRWTAPAKGTINISGEAWSGGGGGWCSTDTGECFAFYPWMLTHNGSSLSDGFTGGTRDLPYDFSSGSGGATGLQIIQVLAGDVIDLAFVPPAGGNVGLNFTVTLTADSIDPAAGIQQLAETVAEMNLQNGIENSLDAKLDAALGALDDLNANDDAAACNSLAAFISAVEAQRGNKLTDDQANQLISSAQEIQAALNCGN
jgi:hypothetical protein